MTIMVRCESERLARLGQALACKEAASPVLDVTCCLPRLVCCSLGSPKRTTRYDEYRKDGGKEEERGLWGKSEHEQAAGQKQARASCGAKASTSKQRVGAV